MRWYLDRVTALVLLAHVAAVAWTVAVRITFPYELEWLEGASLEHVRRIMSGGSLYVDPTPVFVPSIYTPLYFYLAAGLSSVFGLSFLTLRALSLAASLGCFALTAFIVRRETGSRGYALFAALTHVATYKISCTFFDIARIDMVFMFLMLATVVALRCARGMPGHLLAALLACAAYLTKQTAGVMLLPLILYSLILNWRTGLFFGGVVAVSIVGSTAALDAASDGWYGYYIHDLLYGQPISWEFVIGFWSINVLGALPVPFLFLLVYIWFGFERGGEGGFDRRKLFWPLAAASLLGGSWASRLNVGSAPNVLLPAQAVLVIGFALGLQHLRGMIAAGGEERRASLDCFVSVLVLGQLIALTWNPAEWVPDRDDRLQGDAIVRGLSRFDGPVFVASHPYLAVLAGHPTHAHGLTFDDIMRADGEASGRLILDEFKAELAAHKYAAIVLDESPTPWFLRKAIEKHYRLDHEMTSGLDDAFFPAVGWQTRPRWLYVPREPDPAG